MKDMKKDNKESQFAQFVLLQWLREAHKPKTAEEILSYLLDNTAWGQREKSAGNLANSRRKLGFWLRDLCESPEFGDQIERIKGPTKTSAHLFRSKVKPDQMHGIQIENACFHGLAEKFLDVVIPADFRTPSLEDLFLQAREQLRSYRESRDHKKRSVNAYINRISVEPRGLELYRDEVPYEVLKEISRAILDQKCVKLKYKGKSEWQVYHPYGIVIREPKIYFLGVEDKEMQSKGPEDSQIRQLLCNRIKNPKTTSQFNRVPEAFKTQTFINQGGMEVLLPGETELARRRFTLKLRVHDGTDNLLLDLEEFPISRQQVLEVESSTKTFVLTAPGMRASHQLVEWILGRMDRVEVLEPVKLRNYISEHVALVHQLYSPKPD